MDTYIGFDDNSVTREIHKCHSRTSWIIELTQMKQDKMKVKSGWSYSPVQKILEYIARKYGVTFEKL